MNKVSATMKAGGYAVIVDADGTQVILSESAKGTALELGLMLTSKVLSMLRESPKKLVSVMQAVIAELPPCTCPGCLAARGEAKPSRQGVH